MNLTSDNQLLQYYNDIKTKEYGPVIAFVTVASILGIFGNALAFTFFGFKTKRTVSNFLIGCLSLNDIVTSLILGVNGVILLMHTITFTNVPGCRIIRFMNHVPVVNSMLLLLLICVDRYLRICWSTSKWVLQKQRSIKVIVGIVVYSVLLAVRNLFLVDPVEIKVSTDANTTILGHHCTRTRHASKLAIVAAFDFVEIGGLVVIVSSLFVLYSLILRAIIKSKANINKHKAKKQENNCIEMTDCIVSTEIEITSDSKLTMNTESLNCNTPEPNCKRDTVCATIETEQTRNPKRDTVSISNETEQTINPTIDIVCASIESNSNRDGASDTIKTEHTTKGYQQKHKSERKRDTAERNLTLMMLAVTAMSLLSFVPYYVYAIAIEPSISNVYDLGAELCVLSISFILNSTLNPYVMCLVSSTFRLYVKSISTCVIDKAFGL